MSNEGNNLEPWTDPALEARIVAMILGESSDYEKAELDQAIAADPELASVYRHLSSVHDLLAASETAEPMPAEEQAGWKLSPERRSTVLEAIASDAQASGEEQLTNATNGASDRTSQWRRFAAVAAVFVVIGGIIRVIGTPASMKTANSEMAFSQLAVSESRYSSGSKSDSPAEIGTGKDHWSWDSRADGRKGKKERFTSADQEGEQWKGEKEKRKNGADKSLAYGWSKTASDSPAPPAKIAPPALRPPSRPAWSRQAAVTGDFDSGVAMTESGPSSGKTDPFASGGEAVSSLEISGSGRVSGSGGIVTNGPGLGGAVAGDYTFVPPTVTGGQRVGGEAIDESTIDALLVEKKVVKNADGGIPSTGLATGTVFFGDASGSMKGRPLGGDEKYGPQDKLESLGRNFRAKPAPPAPPTTPAPPAPPAPTAEPEPAPEPNISAPEGVAKFDEAEPFSLDTETTEGLESKHIFRGVEMNNGLRWGEITTDRNQLAQNGAGNSANQPLDAPDDSLPSPKSTLGLALPGEAEESTGRGLDRLAEQKEDALKSPVVDPRALADEEDEEGADSTEDFGYATEDDGKSKPGQNRSGIDAIAEREMIRRLERVKEAEGDIADGQRLEAEKDFVGARERFRDGIEKIPKAPLVENKREEAIKEFADSSVKLADQFAREGRRGEAEKVLNEVLSDEIAPLNKEAKKILTRLDDPEWYNHALTPEHAKQVAEVDRRLKVGKGYFDLGDIDNAEKQFDDALRIDRYNMAARRGKQEVELAQSYYRLHDSRRDVNGRLEENQKALAWQGRHSEFGLDAGGADFDGGFGGAGGGGFSNGQLAGDLLTDAKPADPAEPELKQDRPELLFKHSPESERIDEIRSKTSELSRQLGETQSELADKKAQNGKLASTSKSRSTKEDGNPFTIVVKPEPEKAIAIEKIAPSPELFDLEKLTGDEPFSTFSLSVSDVSFKLAKSALLDSGSWPEPTKVRPEEFVNAFDYGDPSPNLDERVACAVEQCAHPFLQQRNLLRISMKTAAVGRAASQPLRLTVLLDKSGSMEREDREASVMKAFEALAAQLGENDLISVIGFARTPSLIADRLPGARANELAALVAAAPSEGGTNLEEALRLAEESAGRQFLEGAQNRIVLITDGAANLGDAEPDSLQQRIIGLRGRGIAFDACGVGADGLNDEILEALARKGDGRYYFLDKPEDADEGFVRQLAGALRPAARNVKVQVKFNPDRVARYRLSGFEKHRLKKEDFRNDTVDAAEIAAAEAGNALYQIEVNPAGQGDIGEVFVRFQDTATGEMVEQSWPIGYQPQAPRLTEAAPSMQLAATAGLLGEKLRGGPAGEAVDLPELAATGTALRNGPFGEIERVQQLVQMIESARKIGN